MHDGHGSARPELVSAVPGSQGVQAELPLAFAKDPAGQSLQVDALVALSESLKLPAGQEKMVFPVHQDPSGHSNPSGKALQSSSESDPETAKGRSLGHF